MAIEGGTSSGIGRNSIDFKVEIVGLDNLRNASEKIQKAVDAEVKKALFVAAKRVESEAKKSLQQGNKSGRLYTLRVAREGEEPSAWFTLNGRSVGFVKRGKPHQASAPGEAPATDTGRLVNSINVDSSVGKVNNELVATIGAGGGQVRYARMLEFGTARMAARPFMFPALEKSKPFILERLSRAVTMGFWKGVDKPGAPPA